MVSEEPDSMVDTLKHTCRVVLLGSAQSGKSALASQFAFHDFYDEYVPTSLDTLCCPAVVDDIAYNVKITDCCADASFAQQRETYLRNADVVLLVYSVTDKNSLEFLRKAVQQARDAQMYTRKGFFPVFVVGTHADVPASQRQVSRSRGEEVAGDICLSHAELVRPLFLRAGRPDQDTAVQDGVGVLTKRVWNPEPGDRASPSSSSTACGSPPPAPLPAGASSTVPFMELSSRDGAAVATLFDALVRLHVISSAFHDLYMPMKSTAITSPIIRAGAAANPSPRASLSDDRVGVPPFMTFSRSPLSALSAAGSTADPFPHHHQRTFSTASSSATAGANAAVAEMSISMNCLPPPAYLFGVQSVSALDACISAEGSGDRRSASDDRARSGRVSRHQDPNSLGTAGAPLTPRTPQSASLRSCMSLSRLEKSQRDEPGQKLLHPVVHLQLSPNSGHGALSFSDAAVTRDHSGPPSPSSPTLLASTRIPIERHLKKDSGLRTTGKSPSAAASLGTSTAASPTGKVLPVGSPGDRKIAHSRVESGASRQSSGSKGAADITATSATAPHRKEKTHKTGKDKCAAM